MESAIPSFDFSNWVWTTLSAPIAYVYSKVWGINSQVKTNTANISNIQYSLNKHYETTQELTKQVNQLNTNLAILNEKMKLV